MKVKRIGDHDLPLPQRATAGAAGYDLRASHDLRILPGDQAIVQTGFAWAIPRGWAGIIKDRSSLAVRHIRTAAGVVDSDYRGMVGVVLRNAGIEPFEIARGDRIAQMVVVVCQERATVEVDDLDATDRGAGGYGSTGSA